MQRMKIFGVIFLLLGVLPVAVQAKGQCFSLLEVEAEQMVRLHSELMVTALSCRYGREGQKLSGYYQAFTQRYAPALRQAETALMDFYEKKGSQAAEDKINHLRTTMANEVALSVAQQSPQYFCPSQARRLAEASGWSARTVRQELARMADQYGTLSPVCETTRMAQRVDDGAGRAFPVRRQ